MDRRKLGKTGEELSMVGFGGIVVKDESPESAASIVAKAIDRDINYFDVAPYIRQCRGASGSGVKTLSQRCVSGVQDHQAGRTEC